MFQMVVWLCQMFSNISVSVQLETVFIIFFKPVLWKIEDHNLSVCLEKKIILIEEYISNGGFYHIFKKCTDSRLHEEASFHVLVRVLRFFP